MKVKFFLVALAAAFMFSACENQIENPAEKTPAFAVVPFQASALVIPADGGSVSTIITSNIAWTIDCSAEWLSVSPMHHDSSDEAEEVTITVSASKNESTSPRSATLTIVAAGFDAVSATFSQAAGQAPAPEVVFNVLNSSEEAVASVSLGNKAGTYTLLLDCNADWAVSSSAEWLTVSPASGEGDADDYISVVASYTSNPTAAAREATLTFTAEGADAPIAVVFSQAAGETLTLTLDEENCTYRDAAWKCVPSSDALPYVVMYIDSESFADFDSDVEVLVLNQLAYWASKYDASVVLNALGNLGEASDVITDLDPATAYVLFAFSFDNDYNLLCAPASVAYTTPQKPESDPSYSAILGTYKVVAEEAPYISATGLLTPNGTDASFEVEISEYYVNDSYYLTADPAAKFSPNYQGETDSFPMLYYEGDLVLPFFYYGNMGFTWGFQGVDGYCAMTIAGFADDGEQDVIEFAQFSWNTEHDALIPAEPFFMSTYVVTEAEETLGYYSGYMRVTKLEKLDAAPTATSASASKKGAKVAKKSVKKMSNFNVNDNFYTKISGATAMEF